PRHAYSVLFRPPPPPTPLPYTTLFRSRDEQPLVQGDEPVVDLAGRGVVTRRDQLDHLAHVLSSQMRGHGDDPGRSQAHQGERVRSEEHTSELQSPYDLVCRLLLEKKKT